MSAIQRIGGRIGNEIISLSPVSAAISFFKEKDVWNKIDASSRFVAYAGDLCEAVGPVIKTAAIFSRKALNIAACVPYISIVGQVLSLFQGVESLISLKKTSRAYARFREQLEEGKSNKDAVNYLFDEKNYSDYDLKRFFPGDPKKLRNRVKKLEVVSDDFVNEISNTMETKVRSNKLSVIAAAVSIVAFAVFLITFATPAAPVGYLFAGALLTAEVVKALSNRYANRQFKRALNEADGLMDPPKWYEKIRVINKIANIISNGLDHFPCYAVREPSSLVKIASY